MLWCKVAFFSTGGQMKRRYLLASLLPVASAPLARAQPSGKIYRIAIVHPSTPPLLMNERGGSPWQALFEELRRLGYEEGRNLKVERYSAEGREDIYSQLAKQMLATPPDLIFSPGVGVVQFYAEAAGRVPIIGIVSDTVAKSFSTSLSRPSANVTGILGDQGVIADKRLQTLREVRPGVRHVVVLTPRQYWQDDSWVQRMYQQQGVRLTCLC